MSQQIEGTASGAAPGRDSWKLKIPAAPPPLEDARLLEYRHPAERPALVLAVAMLAALLVAAVLLDRREAELATFFGHRTLVIERKVLGGVVVTDGGVPTKTLREAALYLTGFRDRDLYGLSAQVDTGLAVLAFMSLASSPLYSSPQRVSTSPSPIV